MCQLHRYSTQSKLQWLQERREDGWPITASCWVKAHAVTALRWEASVLLFNMTGSFSTLGTKPNTIGWENIFNPEKNPKKYDIHQQNQAHKHLKGTCDKVRGHGICRGPEVLTQPWQAWVVLATERWFPSEHSLYPMIIIQPFLWSML